MGGAAKETGGDMIWTTQWRRVVEGSTVDLRRLDAVMRGGGSGSLTARAVVRGGESEQWSGDVREGQGQ